MPHVKDIKNHGRFTVLMFARASGKLKAKVREFNKQYPLFMWSQSITGKLLLPLVIIGFLSLIFSFKALNAIQKEEAAHAAELKAQLIQSSIEDRYSSIQSARELNYFFRKLAATPSVHGVYVIENNSQKIVASSDTGLEGQQFHSHVPHFNLSHATQNPNTHAIDRLHDSLYYHISSISIGPTGENNDTYTLALTLPAYIAQHFAHSSLLNPYSIFALTIILILLTIACTMYHNITQPLSEITALIRGGQKHIPDRLSCRRHDELGELGRSINRVSAEQSRREQQLALAQASAEQGARTKSEFLATISHEIRTPMNSVLGLMKLLMKTPLNDDQQNKLAMALKSASSLMVIINDILDFSKVDAGKMQTETVDFNLIDLVQTQVALFQPKADEKSLYLHLNLDKVKHERVHSDPRRLQQVLTNILDNSVKFTQTGGVTVTVLTHADPTALQQILFRCQVQDTGIGIEPKQQEYLFNAFTQENTSSTRKYNGTGLGLAIVRELCSLLGGSVSVKSQKDHGSTFEIALAFKEPSETSLGPAENRASLQKPDGSSPDNSKYKAQLQQKFQEHAAQGTAPLLEFMSQSDLQEALKWAHTLRSLAGGLGLIELKDSAKKLETTLYTNPKDCSTLIAECDILMLKAGDLIATAAPRSSTDH